MNDDTNAPGQPTSTAAEIARLRDRAASLGSNAGTDLVPSSGAPADLQKVQLAHTRAAAIRMREEAAAIEKQVRAEMEAKLAELRAIAAPLQKTIAQMEEGIWTINLYLGRDEEIVTLTTGTPAPAEETLVLRQEVLSMDEETAAAAETGGIDARNLDVFDAWISQPDNLARVLPETKGVVALVPRRRGRDYADPWVDKNLNEQNRWTYFLIRNGENLYRMRTDFVVGKHLIPATDEFTGLFRERRYNWETKQHEVVDLLPGTDAWDKAAERQDARQRHYMRMALILAGLVDRTTVFHPLPAAGLNLLDARTYAEGRARLVRDAEAVLTDGRPEFRTWLRDLNRQLRVGMRIMGAFNTQEFIDAGGEYSEGNHYHAHDRITPRARDRWSSDKPQTGELYRLEGTRTFQGVAAFYFKFARTTQRWIGSGYDSELRAPKTKGTCLVLPEDRFILPFDLVDVEDLRYYLNSRRQRHHYEYMFPLLQAAIAAKEAEQAAEAPFRALLAGELVKADPALFLDEAATAVRPLVDWWKLGNKWHRPLVLTEDPATEAKAIAAITAEYLARTRGEVTQAGDAQAEAAMVARLRELDPTIMVIGRKRDGGYLAFAPQPRKYSPAAVRTDVWAVEYTATRAGKVKTREWVIPGTRMDRTRILFTADPWEHWAVHTHVTADLTDPEIDAAVAQMVTEVPQIAAAGWPARYRNTDPSPGETLLVQGVALKQASSRFQVWVTRPTDPAELSQAPSAVAQNTVKAAYGVVSVRYTKTVRGGVDLSPVDEYGDRYPWPLDWQDRPRYSGATPARPWHYHWDGKVRDYVAVVECADVQELVTARAERIEAHNKAVAAFDHRVRAVISQVKDAWEARAEQVAYARFLEDYADPSLWEGHRKTLTGLEAKIHPHGRDIPTSLDTAIRVHLDAGVAVEEAFTGQTVADLVTAAGLEPTDLDDLGDLVLPGPPSTPER